MEQFYVRAHHHPTLHVQYRYGMKSRLTLSVDYDVVRRYAW